MKVAIPIWQGRISPVMDAATRLLVVEYENNCEINRIEESIAGKSTFQLASHLADMGVNLLICGAISHPLYSMVAAQKITVIPWITGQIEEVLDAYQGNRLQSSHFLMPGRKGCFGVNRRCRGRNGERNRGSSPRKQTG